MLGNSRRCSRCGQFKGIRDFHGDTTKPKGRAWCKACELAYAQARRGPRKSRERPMPEAIHAPNPATQCLTCGERLLFGTDGNGRGVQFCRCGEHLTPVNRSAPEPKPARQFPRGNRAA